MSTLSFFTTLTQMICHHCGGVWAISQEYLNEAARLGHFKQCWRCPYCGRERGYGGPSKEEELQKTLEAERQKSASVINGLRDNLDYARKESEHFRKSRDGMKGQLERTKRRVKHGVCPCCTRTFQNLQRHMKTEHPGYAAPTTP